MSHHKLVFAVLAAAAVIPTTAFAQASGRVADAVTDNLTPQDREVLSTAEQLAHDVSQILEQWVSTQAVTEERLFSRLYFPIPNTSPKKWTTPYDALADRDVIGPEDKALTRSPALQYAILTDLNGYVPTHNTRFAQPLTGNVSQDYINNRTKRLLSDTASLVAARNAARFLLQRTRSETGDTVYDLSVPVTVRGKHWGCVRIGYRRTE